MTEAEFVWGVNAGGEHATARAAEYEAIEAAHRVDSNAPVEAVHAAVDQSLTRVDAASYFSRRSPPRTRGVIGAGLSADGVLALVLRHSSNTDIALRALQKALALDRRLQLRQDIKSPDAFFFPQRLLVAFALSTIAILFMCLRELRTCCAETFDTL